MSAPPGDIGATIVSYIYVEGFNRNNFGIVSAAGSEMIRNGLQFMFDFPSYSLVNDKLLSTGRDGMYLRWYLNSLIIMVLQVGIGLFLFSMVGCGLAKYRFKGSSMTFIPVLTVMMVPDEPEDLYRRHGRRQCQGLILGTPFNRRSKA